MLAPKIGKAPARPDGSPATANRLMPERSLGPQSWITQAKFVVGSSDSPMEHEANQLANHLLATPPNSRPLANILRFANPSITTAESENIAPASVARTLSNSGHPLDRPLRQEMTQRFGYDFSRVRVHCDGDADQSARDLNAHAYTVGHDISFAANRFAPNTLEGRRLLAHELVHVVQQRNDSGLTNSPRRIARQAPPAPPAPDRDRFRWWPRITTALRPLTGTLPLLTEDKRLAIMALDAIPEGVWDHLDWDLVSVGAAARIVNPALIDQKVLGVCGPAAALNAEAVLSPRSYADLVVNVFHTGKVGAKAVNDTLKKATPLAGMDQSDWMLLSAIQDVNNRVYKYYGRQSEVRESHTTGQVEDDMKATGCVATTTYTCYVTGEIDAATKASNLLGGHAAAIEVVIFLKAGPLNDPSFQKTADRPGDPISKGSPNHFVRLIEPMTFTPNDVTFKAFTWGSVRGDEKRYTFSLSNFQRLVSAFVIGSRDPAIKL